MNSERMREMMEKVRASGCLSAQEMQRQMVMVNGWESLQRIDQWDRWWEAEVTKHVCRAAKLGKRHVPTTSDSVVFFLLGLLFGGYGVFMVVQMNAGIDDHSLGRWFAAGLLALGCLMLFQAWRSFMKGRRYKPVLQQYLAGRRAELETLAREHRPGARICLKCLKYTE